jgi:polyphosphate kinase
MAAESLSEVSAMVVEPISTPHSATGKNVSKFDLNDPSLFNNRELSWMEFNDRVLSQAGSARNPLLERVKFLAIAGSNIDEFFMKRIGGLKQQVAAGIQDVSIDGRTARQQIDACRERFALYEEKTERIYLALLAALCKDGVEILRYVDLCEEERQQIDVFFYDNIFPLMTPQSVDPAHPFPFVSNLSLNLFITLRYPGESDESILSMARVKIPTGGGVKRFKRIGNEGYRYILIEDLVRANLELLFPGMEIVSSELFRVTRNANTSDEVDPANDLLEMIESTLQHRRFAPIVRIQVTPSMVSLHRGRLAAELGLDEDKDVYTTNCMLGLRDLWELHKLELPDLKDPPHYPIAHTQLTKGRSIFHIIRDYKEILLQHPYESFTDSVERFLREAAADPKVRAIKMILYRTDPESKMVKYLIQAAQRGKQVAVVVELKASFDEESNIKVATLMEEAGIHVTYGVVGLKTHAKVILVVREDFQGIRRYVHIGTGNYHPVTARLYSDFGLFIYDKQIGRDATELFNYLTTGFTPKRNYLKLLPAPKILKKALLDKIEREISRHSEKEPGLIRFKMNALEDPDITCALYRASQAGVRVELLVRDSCRLRPGIPGLSENVRVVSILGRFLEHARVYYFRNGGDEEYFIGSADAMRRNLEARVEILVPVSTASLRKELRDVLEMQLNDRVGAWELQADGNYLPVNPHPRKGADSSQEKLIKLAEKRLHEAQRLRKRKSLQAGEFHR